MHSLKRTVYWLMLMVPLICLIDGYGILADSLLRQYSMWHAFNDSICIWGDIEYQKSTQSDFGLSTLIN